MKKLATIISIIVATATFSVAEASVQSFSSYNANRVVEFLNANPEIMLYDANYPLNTATYVYTTDVWKESSGLFSYEVWIYGYNLGTNEVVSTPIDLDYVWINNGGYPVSVARLLGYNSPVVNVSFAWAVPAYRPYVRVPHPHNYYRTYYFPAHRHHAHAPHHNPHHGPAPAPHHNPAPAPHHHAAPAPAHHNNHHSPAPTHIGSAHHNNPAPHNNAGTRPNNNGHHNGATTPSHNNYGHGGNHNSGMGHNNGGNRGNDRGMTHASHGGSHSSASASHSPSHSSSHGAMRNNGGGRGHSGGHHSNSRR